MSTSLNGIDFAQYKSQAKELLRAARSGEFDSLNRIANAHPEGGALTASGKIQLADAQLTIARELEFGSWRALKEHVTFRKALAAFDAGDAATFAAIIKQVPSVLRYRCVRGEWYESGYFQGAMLLHHIAGNPIRCPLPQNVRELAKVMLDHGADPNSRTLSGGTTIGLIVTSKPASEAHVAWPLIDLLQQCGAHPVTLDANVVCVSLCNAAPDTARELLKHGAPYDLRHAAGLGEMHDLKKMVAVRDQRKLLDEALSYAAFCNQTEAARLLIQEGAIGDILFQPGGHAPQTALHNAASNGNTELVRLLLNKGSNKSILDGRWNGSAAGWARACGHPLLAKMIDEYVYSHV